MDADIRTVTADEYPAFARSVESAFGTQPSDEEVSDWRSVVELDRTLAAFDDGEIVGTAGAYSFRQTVPGGASIPVAGVTAVSVRSTHRRRGLLRAMMDRQLDDVAARGEPVAILTASESVIYGRFGYGLATSEAALAIDPARSEFRRPLDDHGSVRLLSAEDARRELPAVHERARQQVPGDITRSDAWWDLRVKDPEYRRQGASAAFFASHRSATGETDGWLIYRVRPAWKHGLPNNTVEVHELGATDPTAEVALWRLVLDIDLVSEVVAWGRPLDEPLRWWLADPRRLRVTAIKDDIWVRLLDIPAALSARRYDLEGEVVFEVEDRFRPQLSGRYRLEGGPDGASCTATDASADLSIDVADLGAAYLGRPCFRSFAAAARVEEHRDGALRRADLMFGTGRVPFCRTGF